MKELDKIKNVEHFDFELLLKGSDLGCCSRNCWSWEIVFFTHGKLRELLELDRER